MKLTRLRKTYYTLLFLFFALLISSYNNIAHGGAILWGGQNLFYFAFFFVTLSLFYTIASSKNDALNWVELFAVSAFCLSLLLILWVGAGPLPNDPDSIISMHSISFMLENGFSTARLNSPLFIGATYSLPMQSLLGAVLVLVTNASFITVAKYLPLILMLILLMIYYALVSTRYDERASLLSLVALASFPIVISFASVFNNVVLGSTFLFLIFLLILMRDSKNRTVLTVLAFVVICSLGLTHHLTFVVLLVLLGVLASNNVLSKRIGAKSYLGGERLNIILLVAITAVLAYYVFAYFGPMETFIKTFTSRLGVEVAAPTAASTWASSVLLQRAGFAVFVIFSIVLSIFAAKSNLKRFLSSHYVLFLALGVVFFALGIAGAFIGVPFNWDRISIYGWAFAIPVTLAILFETRALNRKIVLTISAFLVATLILCNLFAIPSNWLDHTGSNEYTGNSYKDMTKIQEFDSVVWYVKYKTPNSELAGDEIAGRLFVSNSSNFSGSFVYIDNYNGSQNGSSVIVRNEDFYQTIHTFSPAPGIQGIVRTTADRDRWNDIVSSTRLYQIYDNAEVRVFYTP